MNNRILQSVIEITRQRDVDSLEYSLVATLAEILPASEISLCKLVNGNLSDDFEEVARLSVLADQTGEKRYAWSNESRIIPAEPHMRECIQTTRTLTCEVDELIQLLVPLTCNNKTIGILSLYSARDLKHFRELIEGFVKIYANYLTILSESEHDKLTGLYNRRTFDIKLDRLLHDQRRKKEKYPASEYRNEKRKITTDARAWLAIIDIDFFKRVNDEYGHLFGDEVLLSLAQTMKKCFRNSDLLFRFGGEEFVIILEPIPLDHAQKTLERFRSTVSGHHFPQIGTITISAGYAGITEKDYPPAVLDCADKALYFAKGHGRNCIHNYETLVESGKLITTKKSGTIDLF